MSQIYYKKMVNLVQVMLTTVLPVTAVGLTLRALAGQIIRNTVIHYLELVEGFGIVLVATLSLNISFMQETDQF